MGYEIQAIISKVSTLSKLSSSCQYARVCPLKQGFGLIPVVDQLFDELQSRYQDNALQSTALVGFDRRSAAIACQLEEVSKSGPVAYVEAEFFGGEGGQSSIAWINGNVSFGPEHSRDAINNVLRHLGVQATGNSDEFDALGLGRHRHTKKWFDTESN
jgi:hypothetical protein